MKDPAPYRVHLRAAFLGSFTPVIWMLKRSFRRLFTRQGYFQRLALVVLTLAVGFACTIWSLHQRTFRDPLPGVDLPRYQRLASLELHQGQSQYPMSLPLLGELERRTRALEKVLGVSHYSASLFPPEGAAARVSVESVTDGYFSILGVELARGRPPSVGDTSEGVVIAHDLWRRLFGGQGDILGRQVYLGERPAVVSGVAPPGFKGVSPRAGAEVWTTIRRNPPSRLDDPASGIFFTVVGLLKPGASISGLQRELEAFATALEPAVWGLESGDEPARFITLKGVGLDWFTVRDLEVRFRILFGIAAALLLVGLMNAAGLLLSGALALRKQWAIAHALGASRSWVWRHVAADVFVLAGATAVLGTALASLGAVWLDWAGLVREAPAAAWRFDWRVLGVALLLSLTTALLCSLLPALAAARLNLVESLRDSEDAARSVSRWKSGLVVGQLSASFFLLLGAALLLVSLANAYSIDLGIEPAGVASAYVEPAGVGIRGEEALQFMRRLWDRISASPAVGAMAFAEISPFVGTIRLVTVSEAEGVEAFDQPRQLWRNKVTPGYFETLGMKLLAGRDFTVSELLRPPAGGADVVIVSRQSAEMIWPGSNPLNRRFFNQNERKWLEVVGVVDDHRPYSLFRDAPMVYEPLGQGPLPGRLAILARGDRPSGEAPRRLLAEIVDAVHGLDPRIAVFDMMTLPERIEGELRDRRSLAATVPVLALAVLLLAGTAIWGLMASFVRLTRHELGIRMALGARVWDLQLMRLGHCALLAGFGIAAALGALYLIRDWAAAQLYGVGVFEAGLLGPLSLGFVLCSLIFSYLPLRRITRIDPSRILREP